MKISIVQNISFLTSKVVLFSVKTKLIMNQTNIANEFNNYFTSVADEILKKRQYHGIKSFRNYLTNPLSNSFVLYPCDESEVKAHILQLNNNKSIGPNSIPTNTLHLIVNIISLPLSQISIFPLKRDHIQKNLKFRRLFPYLKKIQSSSHLIIGLYHSFLTSIKYLKN